MSGEYVDVDEYYCSNCGVWISPTDLHFDAEGGPLCAHCIQPPPPAVVIYCATCGLLIDPSTLTEKTIARYLKKPIRINCHACIIALRDTTVPRDRRAGVEYKECPYCGKYARLTRDHLIPKTRGGRKTIGVCSKCNNSKASMGIFEWLATLPPDAPQQTRVPAFLERTLSDEAIEILKEDRRSVGNKYSDSDDSDDDDNIISS